MKFAAELEDVPLSPSPSDLQQSGYERITSLYRPTLSDAPSVSFPPWSSIPDSEEPPSLREEYRPVSPDWEIVPTRSIALDALADSFGKAFYPSEETEQGIGLEDIDAFLGESHAFSRA